MSDERRIEPRTLKGFRDYLPSRMIPRERMLRRIERVFHRFGFVPLMTPALEYLEILAGKYGDEGDHLLYRFRDQGDREVALRYDLTVPLARVVAQYHELQLPLRRYQIAPVWRAERPQRGRFREFVQCDGDIVGSDDMLADAEIVQLASALLTELGVARFEVRLNNRKVLSGLMERVGADLSSSGPSGEAAILRTIDKLPKTGREETERLLRGENRLDPSQVRAIFEFLEIDGEPRDVLDRLERLFAGQGRGREGVEELSRVLEIQEASGAGGSVKIDLSIARGLNYYTGTIYEAFLQDLPRIGAVMGGGRYDQLVGMFKGEAVPSVGISLGMDRLLAGLVELGLLEEATSVTQILVTVFDADSAPHSSRIARLLRQAGIGCELYPLLAKMKKQFRHAERLGQRWVVVVGPDEIERGEVAVKDLDARQQVSVPEAGLVAHLRGAMDRES